MKHLDGLKGMVLLALFSVLAWFLIRQGDGWAVVAKVMISIFAFALGLSGIKKVIDASNAKTSHKCYLCGQETTRYCDFKMEGGDCRRYACHLHMCLSSDGKHDFCSDHDDRAKLF